jgi:hypothetical protein
MCKFKRAVKTNFVICVMLLSLSIVANADDNLIFESDDYFTPCYRQIELPRGKCENANIANDISFTYIVTAAGLVENMVFADSFTQQSELFTSVVIDHYEGSNQYGLSITDIKNKDGSHEHYFELQYSKYAIGSEDSLRGSLFVATGKEPSGTKFVDVRTLLDTYDSWLGGGIGLRYRNRENKDDRYSAQYQLQSVISDSQRYSFTAGALIGYVYESSDIQYSTARIELGLNVNLWKRLDLNIRYYPVLFKDKQIKFDDRYDEGDWEVPYDVVGRVERNREHQLAVYLEYGFSSLGSH